MDALRASLAKTAGGRAPAKAVAAEPASTEAKATQRKAPKKVAPEPETRRKVAKR